MEYDEYNNSLNDLGLNPTPKQRAISFIALAIIGIAIIVFGPPIGATVIDHLFPDSTSQAIPCPGGTYTGVDIASNTIGLDLPNGSAPCVTGGSIKGNGKGVQIRDSSTKPTTTSTGTTGIQCGGSNGPMKCNFASITVEGFDTGIRNTPGSTSDLTSSTIAKNKTGVYGQ